MRLLERFIDLSCEISDGLPVYPGHARTKLTRTDCIEEDGYTNHTLSINMHAGTHIDGPMHLTHSSAYISEFGLGTCVGTGCLLDARNEPTISMKAHYEKQIPPESIVLLHTGWDQHYGTELYFAEYPEISLALAEHLVKKQIKMLCLDSPAPDRYPFAVHKLLFENGILIAENLTNLNQLAGVTEFEVMAVPLKIAADSSPARVFARTRE